MTRRVKSSPSCGAEAVNEFGDLALLRDLLQARSRLLTRLREDKATRFKHATFEVARKNAWEAAPGHLRKLRHPPGLIRIRTQFVRNHFINRAFPPNPPTSEE